MTMFFMKHVHVKSEGIVVAVGTDLPFQLLAFSVVETR